MIEKRQYTLEDVKIAMLLNGIEDKLIWEGYWRHYAARGWLNGNQRHIYNLQLHIAEQKDNGMLYKWRAKAVPPDPKPKQEFRQSEPVKLGDIATLAERQAIAKKAGIK